MEALRAGAPLAGHITPGKRLMRKYMAFLNMRTSSNDSHNFLQQARTSRNSSETHTQFTDLRPKSAGCGSLQEQVAAMCTEKSYSLRLPFQGSCRSVYWNNARLGSR